MLTPPQRFTRSAQLYALTAEGNDTEAMRAFSEAEMGHATAAPAVGSMPAPVAVASNPSGGVQNCRLQQLCNRTHVSRLWS
ncbi:hypothetical protein OH799_33265 [Nocardia sp. NBC_00881]|uniref:hypothetical protein n=1 Tax=Nocardia sp. NBC_00881 TaxID=2975995 RepID=UPI003868AABC|nr:hypothetical protein OH799_33265 [Nocardia sp. NBC_00881]